MENGNDFQWDLMIGQLRGLQFNNFGLHQIAQLSCGDVIGDPPAPQVDRAPVHTNRDGTIRCNVILKYSKDS